MTYQTSPKATLRAILSLLVGGVSVAACVWGGSWLAERLSFSTTGVWETWQLETLPYLTIFPAMAALAFAYTRLWKSPPLGLGEKAFSRGAIGLFAGIALMAVAALAAVATGQGAVVQGFSAAIAIVPFLAIAAAIFIQVCAEEMLFRGWMLPVVEQAWGKWIAVILTAALFSMIHALGGVNHWFSFVNLFLGGVALGLVYLKTRGLAAPIALHFGFNWSENAVFGMMPGSVSADGKSLMDVDITGNVFLGGGLDGDGVNTSIAITIGFILVIAATFFSMRKTKLKQEATKPAPIEKKIETTAEQKPIEAAPAAQQVSQPAEAADVAPSPIDATIFAPSLTSGGPIQDRTPAVELPPPPLPQSPAKEPVSLASGPIQKVRTLTGTHQGAVRTVNEDRLFAAPETGLWAVADGMGGHRFGDRAATMVVEYLQGLVLSGSLEERVAKLRHAAETVNLAIYEEAQTNGSRMGSTLVSCVIEGSRIGLVWAGDSRAYRLRGDHLAQLTRDHTQVQELVERGELTPEQAARHPMSHVLVRAVGVVPDLDVESSIETILPGDVFFLCSDGIYDALDESEIVALLKRRGEDADLSRMIDLAVAQGARDNVTAIAIIPGDQPKTENGI